MLFIISFKLAVGFNYLLYLPAPNMLDFLSDPLNRKAGLNIFRSLLSYKSFSFIS